MKASITEKKSSTHEKVLIKLCHLCGELNETYIEPEKCASCKKAFLPSNYFTKIHAKNTQEFKKLFLHNVYSMTCFLQARKLKAGCKFILGDRPIQITLRRALASLSVWQQLKLAYAILFSKEPIT